MTRMKNDDGIRIPSGFLEKNGALLKEIAKTPPVKVNTRVFKLNPWVGAGAVAACLALWFALSRNVDTTTHVDPLMYASEVDLYEEYTDGSMDIDTDLLYEALADDELTLNDIEVTDDWSESYLDEFSDTELLNMING